MNIDYVLVHLLELAAEDDGYRAVLKALSSGTRDAGRRADVAAKWRDTAASEGYILDECAVIEACLGAAYVVYQQRIGAVVVRALAIRSHHTKSGHEWRSFTSDPQSVRAIAADRRRRVSKIELIWHLGNYFKHSDEWGTRNWSTLKGPAKKAALGIKSAGLDGWSSGILQSGAELLGNNGYDRVVVFADIIDEWAGAVLDK